MSVKGWGRSILRRTSSVPMLRWPLHMLSQKGLLPASIWKRLPIEFSFQITLPDGAAFQYASSYDDSIGRALYWRGFDGWEGETTRIFHDLAQQARGVIDVGAYTGIFSLIAATANPASKIMAFEPVETIRSQLVENIALNHFGHRCIVSAQAVSDFSGTAPLHIPSVGTLPSSSSLHPDGFRGYPGELIDVPITTIDDAVADFGPIDLIKIDVEGFEDKVIEGASRTIAAHRPKFIVECNADGPYERVESLMKAHGYNMFHLLADGSQSVEYLVPDASGRYRNFLFS